jgi:hypothetical protein
MQSGRSAAGAARILASTFCITSGRFPSRHNTAKVTSPRFSLFSSGSGSMFRASRKPCSYRSPGSLIVVLGVHFLDPA